MQSFQINDDTEYSEPHRATVAGLFDRLRNWMQKFNLKQQENGDNTCFEPMMEILDDAVIKVVGVGGGGGNAVEHMVRESIEGVEFISINTDAQALRKTSVNGVIQIGGDMTKGLEGQNYKVGRDAALEDRDRIKEGLDGADMVFIAAGMGGGTGAIAAPVIAEVAKELGILTVAVVTKPFSFEGKKRFAFAEQGIEELSKHVVL